ncbi:MAG: hypothetical protein AB7F75_07485 [Planctomycetota bacterium]
MSPTAQLMLSIIGIITLGFAFIVGIILFQDSFYSDSPYEPS